MRLEFDPHSLEDLKYWVKADKKKALKILKLFDEVMRTPFEGTGKPEPLKYALSGCWSRRIDPENRLVYKVEENMIIVFSCRYHY